MVVGRPAERRVPETPSIATVAARLRVTDLFAGAGGLSEGFRQAGFTVLGGSDIDPDACASYSLNFPHARSICGDLRKTEIRAQTVELATHADVVVGGPPCQAFSQVRNHSRLIDDPRNVLYREFVAVLGEALPAAFLMENVPGLTQLGVLEQVVSDLRLDGEYDVNVQVVDAADYGVPQARKRLIFLGTHRSLGASPLMALGAGGSALVSLTRCGRRYLVTGRTPEASDILNALADPDNLHAVTTAQAISDLRYLRAGRRSDTLPFADLREPESAYQRLMRRGLDADLTNVSLPRIKADTVTRLRGIPPGGNYRDLDEALQNRYLSDMRWGPQNGTGRLGRAHFYAYRRLHPHIWARTLNTKADSAYHYSYPRSLSVREFARLQSFPDRFVFTTDPRPGDLPGRIIGGPAHSRYRQVGNAVPPLLGAAIAREIATIIRKANRNKASRA